MKKLVKTLATRYSIVLLLLLVVRAAYAQEKIKSYKWAVELTGALTNCRSWEVEPAVTFLPIEYVGASMGLLFTQPYSASSVSGVTADGQFRWSSTNDNADAYFFALKPSLRFNTPKLWLGRDKEYAFFLSVSPGLTLPVLADREFSIDYFPNQAGVWSAQKRERLTSHGARKVYYHLRAALSLEMDDRIVVSAGYTFSDFDLYGGSRNITVEGKRLSLPQQRNVHALFVGVGIRF